MGGQNTGRGQTGEWATSGEPQRRSILDNIHELQEATKSIGERIASVEKILKENNDSIIALKLASEGYRKTRSRFIDDFERDINLQTIDQAGQLPAIPPGNKAAQDGDVVTDATLYIGGLRNDSLFRTIYGISPEAASFLHETENAPAINLLNARATLKATTAPLQLEEKGEAEWDEAFHNYIEVLKDRPDELPNPETTTPLSKAYFKYWMIHRQIVDKHKEFSKDAASTTQSPQTSTQHWRNTLAAGSIDAL